MQYFESGSPCRWMKRRYLYGKYGTDREAKAKARKNGTKDLLEDYSGYITMLHQLFDGNGLGDIYTEDKIREDLFGERFNMNFHRCFGKLHEDIVKAFKARKGVNP